MPSEFMHISALRAQSILSGFVGVPIMEEAFALLRIHHKNVQRYRQLLKTSLTDFEREYIGGRLREEQLAIETLSPTLPSETSPSDPRAA